MINKIKEGEIGKKKEKEIKKKNLKIFLKGSKY